MSEQIEDPSGEVLDRTSRLVLSAAAVVGRRLADELHEQVARREAAEAAEAARLKQRWDAGQAAARAQVQVTGETWMQQATPEQAAEAWSTAHAWAGVDPTFRADEERLRQGIKERWGVDVGAGDPAELQRKADLERVKAQAEDRAQVTDEMMAGGILAGTGDELVALEDADRHSGNAENHEAAATALEASSYDSEERRQALAERAVAAGIDGETADGRVRAANANAEPIKNATKKTRGQVKAKRRAAANQRTRSDQLSR